MGATEPGGRPNANAGRSARHLDRAPGDRYRGGGDAGGPEGGPSPGGRGNLAGPLARALLAALGGAVVLFALGALLSSSAGLLVVAGLTGAAVGLLLARAAAPGREIEPALTRRQATWLAVGIALVAVAGAAVATWLHAIGEGGALGLVDYLLETFGAIVPLELVVAGITAAWGAGAGPVER